MKKVIAIDMDDTIADLLFDWVGIVNKEENEQVLLSDIKCWNIDKYFKCNKKVFSYLKYDLFRNLSVIKGSQDVIKKLVDRYEVYIVTTATSHTHSLSAKVEWLKEHFDFIPTSNIVLCGNKSIIKADIMVDDGIHNLEVFEGRKLLFDAPHNRTCKKFERVVSWKEIEQLLL